MAKAYCGFDCAKCPIERSICTGCTEPGPKYPFCADCTIRKNKGPELKANRTKLIIFDLDGTLINTIDDLATACNYALRQCGYREHAVADYPQMVGNGIYRLMARALRAQGIDAAEDGPEVQAMTPHFKGYYDQHNADLSRPYPGITELLAELQNEGYMLAVASNKYQAATEKLVRSFFPDIRWTAIFGQRDGIPHKPDPMVVREIMERAGIHEKCEVCYVGDSNVDMDTAANAGVSAIAVCWGFVREEDLKAERIAHTSEELKLYINKNRT